MRYSLCALALVLTLTPGLSSAQKKSPAEIPESLVKACLERCGEESTSCSRRVREAEKKTKEGKVKSRRRRPGLRWCGCAYVRCKLMCRSYAWFDHFMCTASSRPRPLLVPQSPERSCKRDRDCTLMPTRSPCGCLQCGVFWRRAVNKKALRALRSKWAKRKCAKRACPTCDSWALGKSAFCNNGQCSVRP